MADLPEQCVADCEDGVEGVRAYRPMPLTSTAVPGCAIPGAAVPGTSHIVVQLGQEVT